MSKMLDVSLKTTKGRPFRARATSATDNGYPTRAPTLTAPSGIGDAAAQTTSAVWDIGPADETHNGAVINFFGAGADNATFSARIIKWRKAPGNGTTQADTWIPTVLAELACTLSTQVGVAGGVIVATDRLVDTISLTGTTANDDVSISIVSPANNTMGEVTIDLSGVERLEITFTTGGSATDCNALVAWI